MSELIDVSVRVKGIKKRCRKVSVEVFTVIEATPYVDNYDLGSDEVAEKMMLVVKREMKSYERISLKTTVYKLGYDRGFQTKSMQLFDPRNQELNVML